VRHLSEGTLRRIYDEPLALTAADQAHYDSCEDCKGHFLAIANDVRATSAALSLPSLETQPRVALAALRARIDAAERNRPVRWYERWTDRTSPGFRRRTGPAAAVLIAGALLVGLTATGVAQTIFKIFEPHSFVAVSVSPSDFSGRAKLLDYGAVTWTPGPPKPQPVADAGTATTLSGLPVLTPATLPTGVTGPVSYGVIAHATASLTFDAARLRASAAKQGVRVASMPGSIDRSTIYVSAGPALVELWGGSAAANGQGQAPTLVIAQTRVPLVESTGASVTQLEDYLLSQPGVPPDIAAQIKAIKDPSTTLPIPIPAGLATTRPVVINGAKGLLIDAGIAAGVVWENNGVIYAVGGQLTPDQVIALASSLH
jgi:hypothetical protein